MLHFTNPQHLFTEKMFSVLAVQRYELLCAATVNAAVSSDSQVHTWRATSQSSSLCTD